MTLLLTRNRNKGIRQDDGQALYEMALVMFLFLVIMVGVIEFGPRVYVRLAVDTAAYDCATAGVETLDKTRGMRQARVAADETLRGFRLDTSRATVSVNGTWERSAPVTCQVTYKHKDSFLPFASMMFPDLAAKTEARVTLLTATFKSKWD
jgi:Flp pilus assembly protein TadG